MEKGGRRRSQRANLLMAATLEHDGGTIAVKLRNLSADGALIEGDDCPPAGAMVIFRKNELEVPGRIAWADGRRAGIAFDTSLDPDSVRRDLPAPRPLRDEIHKRPGFRTRLSAADRRFAETYFGRPPAKP